MSNQPARITETSNLYLDTKEPASNAGVKPVVGFGGIVITEKTPHNAVDNHAWEHPWHGYAAQQQQKKAKK